MRQALLPAVPFSSAARIMATWNGRDEGTSASGSGKTGTCGLLLRRVALRRTLFITVLDRANFRACCTRICQLPKLCADARIPKELGSVVV